MPFEPLRFIHAARVCLDHPLEDTGPLPEELRGVVEEATVTAFDRLVSAAVERRVDFLLLTGDSFVERDRSLRARVALLAGLKRLAEEEISVFVLPGDLDPSAAWRDVPDLPGNTTVFYNPAGEAVAVLRDGRVIASIAVANGSDGECGTGTAEANGPPAGGCGPLGRRPFLLGLRTEGDRADCPFDYAALVERGPRRSAATRGGIAHNPGGTQGLSPRETGPHGATLVEVGREGAVERTFLPLAPVRWERFALHINSETDRGELQERMEAAIRACRPEPAEAAWLVRWSIHGGGPLFESLQKPATRAALIAALGLDAVFEGGVRVHHGWRFYQAAVEDSPARFESQPGGGAGADGDGVAGAPEGDSTEASPLGPAGDDGAHDYFRRLQDELPLSQRKLVLLIDEAASRGEQAADPLRRLVADLDQEAIAAEARRLGAHWFLTQERHS